MAKQKNHPGSVEIILRGDVPENLQDIRRYISKGYRILDVGKQRHGERWEYDGMLIQGKKMPDDKHSPPT